MITMIIVFTQLNCALVATSDTMVPGKVVVNGTTALASMALAMAHAKPKPKYGFDHQVIFGQIF